MSRHSKGQHNRKLHQIVSKPESDRKPSQVGSEEDGSQSQRIKQTNHSRQEICTTNGTYKPAKEIRGGKQEMIQNNLTNSKASSFVDPHLTEKSTNRGCHAYETKVR